MDTATWRLLLLALPASQPGLRMRVWRSMKALGAAGLRDGVWLLPETRGEDFSALAAEVVTQGGTAELLKVTADEGQQARYPSLFDRSGEYDRFLAQVQALAADQPPARRRLLRLRQELDQLVAIDFFPGQSQAAARAALEELERRLQPDEPEGRRAILGRLDPAAHQGRVWATRARPWVDRLASAWLIRRHIDPAATILWLAQPADCPAGALGFDFDGAAFSHVIEANGRERVSFETLMLSFGLDSDPALARLAGVIHYLDVGGLPAPEAAGLEVLLVGMRARLADDDALLAAVAQVLDDLYMSFLNGEPND